MKNNICENVNKFPLVTLITPTFNQASYLAETIESVLAQDYPNIEYIVLDDGSTDNTSDVLRKYDNLIKWERHENMGQSASLNKGWRSSQGQIIGYISSDDRLNREAVSKSVKVFMTQPNVIVTYSDFSLVDAAGRTIRNVNVENFTLCRLVEDLVCLPGPGAFFRRSAFEAEHGWNQQLQQVADFDFWMRLSRHGDFCHINHVLADYRIHQDSASYRPISAARADEIIEVVTQYWINTAHSGGINPLRSRAMSYILAARLHFISGRYNSGLKRLANAFRLSPRIFNKFAVWRLIAAGLLRRLYYDMCSKLKK